jgi:pimeloyl-ACP methyl ester carboxylesterase
MIFYSGFSLCDDEHFFKPYLIDSDYTVAGFSYGAIKAFEYALKSQQRIDRLQLFSPAFFQSKSDSFKRLQLLGFKKNPDAYISQFIKGCFLPLEPADVKVENGTYDELKELLEYEWSSELLEKLHVKGLIIEVYFGSEDAIIDVSAAKEFFQPYTTTFLIQHANHFLQQKERYESD